AALVGAPRAQDTRGGRAAHDRHAGEGGGARADGDARHAREKLHPDRGVAVGGSAVAQFGYAVGPPAQHLAGAGQREALSDAAGDRGHRGPGGQLGLDRPAYAVGQEGAGAELPVDVVPQASSLPVLVSARIWPPPPNRLRTVVPDGSAALTGVLLSLLVEPLPSSPNPLSPQMSTWPVLVSVRLSNWVAATPAALVPAGSLTVTGVVLLLVTVPMPSCPDSLSPQASTWPVLVSARLCVWPVLIALTVVPTVSGTGMGTSLGVVLPLPSSPSRLAPQASTSPVLVSARLCSHPARM